MIINHNLQSMNAHRQMGINQAANTKSMEKLSSGLRVNRAGDDAAGLTISEKMRSQIKGLNQASRNAQDGVSLIQTAEGALDETHSILQRMRELAVQASSDTNDYTDRNAIQAEMDTLTSEIDRISTDTQFNEKKLLDGDEEVVLQVGANKGQQISINLKGMSADDLGLVSSTKSTVKIYAGHSAAAKVSVKSAVVCSYINSDGQKVEYVKTDAVEGKASVKAQASVNVTITGYHVKDQKGANEYLGAVDRAIQKVSEFRSSLGAVQNRLEHTIKNVDNAAENTQAAESRIRDVDMAEEMMSFTKTNVLNQAAQSMLAQANQQPNQVLQLLG